MILIIAFCAVNALGNHIPPFFVFPRVNVQENWLLTAPPGSSATGHPKATGWMTEEGFSKYIRHFVKYAKPTAEQPILLLLDNHSSHVSVDVINFAKEHNVTMMSFPPHCSHKLQPLDVSVFGPFKTYVNQASDNWMRQKENAGKSMTIHVVPKIVSYAFPKAMTPSNIMSGFKATGIYPFDKNIFQPEHFLSAYSTDRPLEEAVAGTSSTLSCAEIEETNSTKPNQIISKERVDVLQPSTPNIVEQCLPEERRSSAEQVRPFGKRPPRRESSIKRKKGKSQVFTDTPVKKAIEEEAIRKNKATGKKTKRNLASSFVIKKVSGVFKEKKSSQSREKVISSDESESDIRYEDICNDASDDEVSEPEERQIIRSPTIEQLDLDDHILVMFRGKKSVRYYVGRIIRVHAEDNEVETSFMRGRWSVDGKKCFSFPENNDSCLHSIEDIIMKLPYPTTGQTNRAAKTFDFHCPALAGYKTE